ncbi:putative ganglioside-induced differentiation-associated protein 1 [Scophthalmus maximus]|uniref:Ganglioside-induced differentiation-associated protein 1 n=1 Tax=Scophthalmus maximus TaxID=52904 RepID=A0A2U9CVK8_SCOMX|nr:ganglioside-induced differentiation-associated protein 1 isoform X2 [Scophthalmus maximus]AWP20725.1 putative ganglioside-induced differentiation-associated protein 1 [Scophthalmus maximus]
MASENSSEPLEEKPAALTEPASEHDEQQQQQQQEEEQEEQRGAAAEPGESRLTLYHWTQSFNSQKVRLAIAEKGLRCEEYDVSLPLSEHNEPWFMRLNPTGEVPVLVHRDNVICDPTQIMDYLEHNFNDESIPKLVPEEGSTYYHRVQHYRELLDSLQMDAYTHGCILHPEITVDSHIPAYAATCIRTQIGNTQSELKRLAEQNPELKDAYVAKQRRLKSKLFDHGNMKYLKKLLDELESVMDQVETELQRRVEETPEEGSQSWLCGEFFSMADVSLAVTLHRLKFLGLSRRYWGNGNRVNLETYYERVVERPAFWRVLGHVNNILISAVLPVAFRVARKNAPAIVGTTLLIGVLGGATYFAFLYMKKRLTAFS